MAHAQAGDVKSALALLAESRGLVESETFTDVDRAEVLYRLGVCRYKLSSISTAVGLFDEALSLAERSGLPCDELKLNVFAWRSRCYRRQRDYEASREDVERALELAEALRDARALAPVYFQASMLAERDGHWVLARTYAEKAKAHYEEVADRGNVGRLLNNLGAMDFLLGSPDDAIERFKQAYAIALEVDRSEDAATAVNSLAQVHLRTGDVKRAEEQARHALEIIGEREDMLDEVGNARLVLGKALLEQGRLDEADDGVRRIRGRVRAPVFGVASCCRVDRPGRPGDAAGRRASRSGSVPPCSRGAPGLQVLREGGVPHCGNQALDPASAVSGSHARVARRSSRCSGPVSAITAFAACGMARFNISPGRPDVCQVGSRHMHPKPLAHQDPQVVDDLCGVD